MNEYLNIVRRSFLTFFVFTYLTYLTNITKLHSLLSSNAGFNQRHSQIVWINLILSNHVQEKLL